MDRIFRIGAVQERPRCKHPGCHKAGFPCLLVPGQRPHEYLCTEHAIEQGYCAYCGDFAAGTSGFDFVHPGTCDACNGEIKSEVDDLEETDLDDFLFE